MQAQLETSQLNAKRLETELAAVERQLQELQGKLDQVR